MKKNIKVGLYLALASVVALFVVGIGVMSFAGEVGKDPGVSACQEMKANAESGKKSSGAKMTETQYKAKRAPFEKSSYNDLKTAGTNLVDTVYQMDQKGDDADLAETMVMLTALQSQYTALQTACGAHGVSLPNLKKA